jgi:hypothetical protein
MITIDDKLVDLKIRRYYRDKLKTYCNLHGHKMYRYVEDLIDQNCKVVDKTKLRLLKSNDNL